MRITALFAALVAVVALASAPVDTVYAQSKCDTKDTQSSLLFALEGRNAELKPRGGRRFTLTIPIRGPHHLVTWFTDRPARDAGHLTVTQLLDIWSAGNDSFASDPPNVAIVLGEKIFVAEMTNPRITESKTGVRALVSTMTLLSGTALEALRGAGSGIAQHARRVTDNSHSGRLTAQTISLFIDNGSIPCSAMEVKGIIEIDRSQDPYSAYCYGRVLPTCFQCDCNS